MISLAVLKAAGSAVLGLLRRVPWQAYALAAIIAAVWWWSASRYQSGYEAGVADERAHWEQLQADANQEAKVAEAKRDKTAGTIAAQAQASGTKAIDNTRTETAKAQERIREVRIEVPANCPVHLPPRVQTEIGKAIDRANAAGSAMRAAGNP